MNAANVSTDSHSTTIATPALSLKLSWPLVAVVLTVALFLLMAYLITPDGRAPQTPGEEVRIDLSRKERDEQSPDKNRPKPDKPVRDKTPPPPSFPESRPQTPGNNNIAVDLPDFDGTDGAIGFNPDRRATPIVRIPPDYPRRPLQQNVEGWVLVEFTITRTGTVEDARVIDAQPPGAFERATLRAIARWKYQPKTVNGEAVPQYNMRELFHYEIKDS